MNDANEKGKTAKKRFSLLSAEEIRQIFQIFDGENPNPKSELAAPNRFCFLVSVVLSAQTTDKAVNLATKPLYEKVRTPQKMAEFGEQRLGEAIKSIGLWRAKAKNVIKLSEALAKNYGENSGADEKTPFPQTLEEFLALAGVGRKTALVMLNAVYGKAVMPVDTHILRLSRRLGFCDEVSPLAVEKELLAAIPEECKKNAHHHLVLHGRYVCTARNPSCETCKISSLCKKNFD